MKRVLVVLLLVIVVTAVVGYFRGWFSATTVSAGGNPGLTFTWHPDKFKADMNTAGSTIQRLSKAAVDAIKGKTKPVSETESTLTGKVVAVDAASQTVQLETGGQTIPLTLPEAQPGLEQLVGKNVTVTLEKSGDSFVVRAIAETK